MININALIASIMAAITSIVPMSSIPHIPNLPFPNPIQVPAPAPGPTISADQAQNIAANHSGAPRHQWREVEVELDNDDGRLSWEIEFDHGNWEYEYDIDAYTGAIISWEKEWDS